MRIGFLTGCLGQVPLEDLVPWAAGQGFRALEVSAWPLANERDFAGSSIDVARLDKAGAERIKSLFAAHGMVISSLAYYDNNLDRDPAKRAFYHDHLRKVIDAAALLGVDLVGTFVGRDITKTIAENMKEFARVFPPLVKYARDKGVRLMIENCPMEGWQAPGQPGNCAYSPELWREMFRLVPDEDFGLNYDPSHLYWQQIDYLAPIREFGSRIFHTHAKDTEILEDRLNATGIFGPQLAAAGHGEGWWRYRMPGLGEIDWRAFVGALGDIGFNGAVSIEHEDPLWGGSEEKTRKGLILGYRCLSQFVA
ncbi:MAG: sugar phosphate isomerase/epimerase family protein [Bacteroidota bacterium]